MKNIKNFIKIKEYKNFDEYLNDHKSDNIHMITEQYYFDIFENPKYTYNRYLDYKQIIYESILKSYDTKKLISKIKDILLKKYNINENTINFKQIESTSITLAFTLNLPSSIYNEFLEDTDIKSTLNLFNYKISKKTKMFKTCTFFIEPLKSELKTDYIYNDLNGIIYHITDIKNVDRILNKGLIPRKTKYRDVNERIYFVLSLDNLDILIKTLDSSKEYCLLKIDLNKLTNNKIDFFIDTAISDYEAIFTSEFIPSYCIEKLDISKYL